MALEPESLLAPALRRAQRDSSRGPGSVLVACLIAAPIAVLAVSMLTPASKPYRDANPASAEPHAVRASSFVVPQPALRLENQTDDRPTATAPIIPAVTRAQDSISTTAPIDAALPAPSSADTGILLQQPPVAAPRPAPPPAPALRQMDPSEVRVLIQQGEHFMAVGDVVAARMVFQRAAETGDAGAAMALGATYDPFILTKLGTMGMVADVTKARHWYQKAREFGSNEAPRRLELLANR